MLKPVLLAVTLLAGVPAVAQPTAATATTATTLHEALRALFAASDEAQLKRNPLQALFRGDMRYADQFGDFITDDYNAREKAAAEADLAALKQIDRAALNADDKISYDVFKYQTEIGLRGFEPELLEATIIRPIDHFSGFQTFVPDLSSGEGAAPFKTVKDYDDNLKRLAEYVVYLDRAIGRMQQGLAERRHQPAPRHGQRRRAAGRAAAAQGRGQRLLQAGDEVPRQLLRRRQGATDRGLRRLHPATSSTRRRRGCATSSATTMCPRRGRRSASTTCRAAARCTATSSKRRRRRR